MPDIIVKKVRNTWQAFLNPEVMPKLSINQAYARVLREQRGTDGAANMGSRLQEARWLIKNVQQRFDTILRVAEAIVERQGIVVARRTIAKYRESLRIPPVSLRKTL